MATIQSVNSFEQTLSLFERLKGDDLIGAKAFSFSSLLRESLHSDEVARLDLNNSLLRYNLKYAQEFTTFSTVSYGVVGGIASGGAALVPGAMTGAIMGMGFGAVSLLKQWCIRDRIRAITEDVVRSLHLSARDFSRYHFASHTEWPYQRSQLKVLFFCDEDGKLQTKISQRFFEPKNSPSLPFISDETNIALTDPRVSGKGSHLLKLKLLIDLLPHRLPMAQLRVSKKSVLTSVDLDWIPRLHITSEKAEKYEQWLVGLLTGYQEALEAQMTDCPLSGKHYFYTANLLGKLVPSVQEGLVSLLLPEVSLAYWDQRFNEQEKLIRAEDCQRGIQFIHSAKDNRYHLLLTYCLEDPETKQLLHYQMAQLASFPAACLDGYRQMKEIDGKTYTSRPNINEFLIKALYSGELPTKKSYRIPALGLTALSENKAMDLFTWMSTYGDCEFFFNHMRFEEELSEEFARPVSSLLNARDYERACAILTQKDMPINLIESDNVLLDPLIECYQLKEDLIAGLEILQREYIEIQELLNTSFEGRKEETKARANALCQDLELRIQHYQTELLSTEDMIERFQALTSN